MTCLLCVQMPTRVCVNAHGQKPKFISLVGMSADPLCVTLDHVFVYACVCVCVYWRHSMFTLRPSMEVVSELG